MANTPPGAAGVTSVEIDLTGKAVLLPTGTPAGVIGISKAGPAFVPRTVADFTQFKVVFGGIGKDYFGPIAVDQWLQHRSAATFMRVLGTGTGKKRTTGGSVTGAGFVVGGRQVQEGGTLANNAFAGNPEIGGGVEGRTYFLGAFMSQSAGSTIWSDAGVLKSRASDTVVTASLPVVRGVLMIPSGVVASLSGSDFTNAVLNGTVQAAESPPEGGDCLLNGGGMFGDVYTPNTGGDRFVMLLNGHIDTPGYPNVISASFDPDDTTNYFATKFNTDPSLTEQAGHCLYSHFNLWPAFATVTGSQSALRYTGTAAADQTGAGTLLHDSTVSEDGTTYTNNKRIAFLVTGSGNRNSDPSNATQPPNYEGFVDRFSPAQTPWIISQDFGDGAQNLFKLVAMDDGSGDLPWEAAMASVPAGQRVNPGRLKVTIKNILKVNSDIEGERYGQFDVEIRDLLSLDSHGGDPLERFSAVNLNPASDDFIGRRIGDQHTFFNFDAEEDEQRLVVEGNYPNVSNLVRVQLADAVLKGYPLGVSDTSLPVGFRGLRHLVTSGSAPFPWLMDHGVADPLYAADTSLGNTTPLMDTITPPVPFRLNINSNTGSVAKAEAAYTWGVQVSCQKSISRPNDGSGADKFNDGLFGFTKFYPGYQTAGTTFTVGDNAGKADSSAFGILDSDRYLNNMFTMERIQIVTYADLDRADSHLWTAALYRRDGKLAPITIPGNDDSDSANPSTYATSDTRTRFLNVSKDFTADNLSFLNFTTLFQGGFDGVNIFNSDRRNLTDNACRREAGDPTQGGVLGGSTILAYKKAIDVMAERTATLIHLLAIPGLRHSSVTNYAMDAIEDRFDAMYIMDIEEKDQLSSYVTSSLQKPDISVINTVNAFADRGLNTSFAAAYFPDVKLTEAAGGYDIPPSAMVLGAYGLNDNEKASWFAPAGLTRGIIRDVSSIPLGLEQADFNSLYDNDINPIMAYAGGPGPGVMGNKTLLRKQSALDRVNVRRLLIEIRRRVRAISDTILFEPNRASTLANFAAKVTPELAEIQTRQGLDRFKVVIDTTTTTQADVENNTIRGRIILQPTKSVEFIELDFVLTNTIDADA